MPSLPSVLLLALVWNQTDVQPQPSSIPVAIPASATPTAMLAMSGREEDARVAQLAYRLALAGRARCPTTEPTSGLVLQHLSQFERADRPGVVAALPLDRGPGVIAVAPDSPAAAAGIQAGDIVLAINGIVVPPETGLTEPFTTARAHARADAVDDLLAVAHPLTLTLLRGTTTVPVRLTPISVCPSRVYLARSGQRNAYADGHHVFLTTGMLPLLRNDDELAFVIAHEMAHNILGHAAIMRSSAVRKGLGMTFGHSGTIVRGTETEADALGATIMLDAGLDPFRGAAILKRLGGGDLGIALLATHEPAGKRLAAIQALGAVRPELRTAQ